MLFKKQKIRKESPAVSGNFSSASSALIGQQKGTHHYYNPKGFFSSLTINPFLTSK